MRQVFCAALVVFALYSPAHAQQQPPTTVAVGVVKAERRPIAKAGDFVGRVEAISRVEIRARITGFLEKVLFKEGDLIKEGSPLYRIEKGLFEAQVRQAEGALERSQAAKALSALQLSRAEESNLATTRINLGYTDIVAPITGKVGRTNITRGNVVSPDSGPLTVIVSQDPMYVSFPVSQREFLRAQAAGRQVDISKIKVRLRFADGTSYQQEGSINFIDVQVDRATDTILVRATFPNPAGALVDGQFVRIEIEREEPEEKVVIPQAALIADQEGVYVFAVEDGKAAVKRVKPGNTTDTGVAIDQGLAGGELVIVDGLMLVRPGTEVRATPSRILSGG
jgi:membrane fusion protein (multidrug efflux system)